MKKIYIGNLSYKVTENELETAFADFGQITNIALIKDRATGRLKGFGFIEFNEETQAEAALAMNGKELLGRPLKVSIARERTETGGGRGGDRRRGGNGSGAKRW